MPKQIFSNVDILHVEWIYPDAYAAVKFAQKKGIKTVGVVHGNEAIQYFGPQHLRKKYRKVLNSLDRVIVVSRDLETKLVQEYGVLPERISIIFNGVDTKNFSCLDQYESRLKLGLPSDIPLGVCVARLSEEKNIDILIRAMARQVRREQ